MVDKYLDDSLLARTGLSNFDLNFQYSDNPLSRTRILKLDATWLIQKMVEHPGENHFIVSLCSLDS